MVFVKGATAKGHMFVWENNEGVPASTAAVVREMDFGNSISWVYTPVEYACLFLLCPFPQFVGFLLPFLFSSASNMWCFGEECRCEGAHVCVGEQ